MVLKDLVSLQMSDNELANVPPFIRQRDIVEEIGNRLPERVRGDWSKLEFNHRRLSMYAEGTVAVTFATGETGGAFAPRGISALERELRKLMYQDNVGTWLSVTWTVTKNADGSLSVDAVFNYDDEPDWDDDIHPGLYGIDLEDFPRSEDNIPEWLSSLLAEAEKVEADKNAK